MKIIYVPSIFILVMMCNIFCASDHIVTIERYQSARDRKTVLKILNEHYNYMMHESSGRPEGTIIRIIDSGYFTTDVLRVNNKTVGFVSYFLPPRRIITFFCGRNAVIHLIGFDKEHLHQGYGTQLLKHAISELEQLQASKIKLSVKKDNVHARKFYEKEGFLLRVPVVENVDDPCYTYWFDCLPDNLPQGNIIQRNKGTAAAIFVAGATLLLWKFSLPTPWARYIPKWKTHE